MPGPAKNVLEHFKHPGDLPLASFQERNAARAGSESVSHTRTRGMSDGVPSFQTAFGSVLLRRADTLRDSLQPLQRLTIAATCYQS